MDKIISVESVISAINAADARYVARVAENVAAAGMAPTVDRLGRMHAPRAGYCWNGDVYAAGEYLGDEKQGNVVPISRFLATVSAAEKLKALGVGFTTGTGFERDGVAVCYVYGHLWSGHATAVKSIVPASRKILSLAADATGKTWATTAGKLFGKIYPLACAPTYSMECIEDVSPELDDMLGEWFSHKMETGKSKKIPLEIGYNYSTVIISDTVTDCVDSMTAANGDNIPTETQTEDYKMVEYEFNVEEIDADGDIVDVTHHDTYASAASERAELLKTNEHDYHVALVRDAGENREWCYISQRGHNVGFVNAFGAATGRKLPAKLAKQVADYHK